MLIDVKDILFHPPTGWFAEVVKLGDPIAQVFCMSDPTTDFSLNDFDLRFMKGTGWERVTNLGSALTIQNNLDDFIEHSPSGLHIEPIPKGFKFRQKDLIYCIGAKALCFITHPEAVDGDMYCGWNLNGLRRIVLSDGVYDNPNVVYAGNVDDIARELKRYYKNSLDIETFDNDRYNWLFNNS